MFVVAEAKAGLAGGTMPIASSLPLLNEAGPNNFRKILVERQNYVLTEALTVEHVPVLIEQPYCTEVGVFLNDEFNFNLPSKPATIPAGTRINSYYLYIDPEIFGSGVTWTTLLHNEHTNTCPGETEPRTTSVLGYIFTADGLDSSDFLGIPFTNYPSGNQSRGLESGDVISSSLQYYGVTTVTVKFDASDPFDAIRVIEIAAPSVEPVMVPHSIWSLGVLVLLTFLIARRYAS